RFLSSISPGPVSNQGIGVTSPTSQGQSDHTIHINRMAPGREKASCPSADLGAALLITYRSAWLSDQEGPTAETTAALYRAKYMVAEAVSGITRMALTLGGAHGWSSCSGTARSARCIRRRRISASTTWASTS